ncbi:DUF3189 family protein [Thermoanaerobacterium sp. RBIITD]|uniref:DUF3189 family protein n=1 Tax=Thermoanaerobacterium sp. RBIITD TaxID=1550240 RepID=UPI000BB8BFB5|nr:DUF3189 family protein [Thermoanaerobacterium sp. RBIITD]SNX52766.1 Protein of unknown function [Thermoanaerobacterium sp. RBIITD]
MKIIYYSYYGCYSSVIAAYIHTELIKDYIKWDEFLSIPEILKIDYGEMKYIGIDENYSEIYTMGMKNFSDNIKKTLEGIRKVFNLEYEKLIFIDTNKLEPRYLKLFLTLERTSILKNVIDYLLYILLNKRFYKIKDFVVLNKKNLISQTTFYDKK